MNLEDPTSPDPFDEDDPLLVTEQPINDDAFIEENVEENVKVKKKKKKRSLSWCRIMLLTISFSGCIMCWSVEIAYATPFLEEIGLSKAYVSYNWLIGPLSALFVQPVVGIVSDYCFIPCIGRRKPFLFIGCAFCAVCLLLFSWSDVIAKLICPHNEGHATTLAIVIALVSFCVMDGSINTLHSAIKTLVIDVIPVHQQTTANLYLSFFAGFGNSMGFIIGFIDFVGVLKMKFLGNNIRPVYFLCCCWLTFSCAITFFSTCEQYNQEKYNLNSDTDETDTDGEKKDQKDKEAGEGSAQEQPSYFEDEEGTIVQLIPEETKHFAPREESPVPGLPLHHDVDEEGLLLASEMGKREAQLDSVLPQGGCPKKCLENCQNCFCNPKGCALCCWDFITDFPDSIIRAYFVRFFIYFSKFFCFVYMGDFVGRQIYGGSPTGDKDAKERFDAGVRWGSLCFGILSVFNMINAPIINFLSGWIPIRVIWGIGQSAQFFGLFACYWVNNKWLLLLIFYWLSFMETCCISFPYAILNAAVKKSKWLKKYKGLTAGIFVSSQCFPEILVSTLGGLLVRWLIDDWKLHSGIMISVGGVCGGIALVLILFIKIPEGMVRKGSCDDFCCVRCAKKIVKKIRDEDIDDDYEKSAYETIDDISDAEDLGEFEGIIHISEDDVAEKKIKVESPSSSDLKDESKNQYGTLEDLVGGKDESINASPERTINQQALSNQYGSEEDLDNNNNGDMGGGYSSIL